MTEQRDLLRSLLVEIQVLTDEVREMRKQCAATSDVLRSTEQLFPVAMPECVAAPPDLSKSPPFPCLTPSLVDEVRCECPDVAGGPTS